MIELPVSALGPAYGFLDPHAGGTELKRVASRAAIIVVRPDDIGRIFVFHAWAARVKTDDLMDELWKVSERFHVKTFGVEANAMQSLFVDAIARDVRLRNRRLPLMPVTQPTNRTKADRVRSTLQPLLGAGRLFLLEGDAGMEELRHEIATFPMNPRADMVDALASACRLVPPPRARREYDAERDAKLRYLRSVGAPIESIREAAHERSPIGSR
jgi:hypothetical protein